MLDRARAALIVIDFQEKLLPAIPKAEAIIPNAVKLIRFARDINLPIFWTEQYPKGLGHTVDSIASELEGYEALEKTSFGCMGDAGFADALKASGRDQLLLTGVETHVCVMQTAVTALEQGLEVFVPRDGVASRAKSDYKAGLSRMQRSGAVLGTTEMFLFELVRVAGTPEFKKVLPLVK